MGVICVAEKKEETKGGCLGCLVIIVVLFLLIGGCTMIFGDEDEQDEPKEKVKQTSESKKEKQEKDNTKEKVKEASEKSKIKKDESPKPMTEEEYQGVVKSYISQIHLAGEDLEKLSYEMNGSGRTTNKGKDLIYAIYGSLDSADFLIKGPKDDVIPPKTFEQDHAEILEGNQHFQNASESFKAFEESEDPNDLNNALDEIKTATDIVDISVRNVLDN